MSSGAGEGANSSHYKQVETPAGGDKRPYYKERRGGGYRKEYHPRGGDYQQRAEPTTEGGAEANYNFDAVYTSGENGGHYKERRFSRGGYRGGRGGASRGGYRGGDRGGYYRGGSRHYDNEGYTVDQQPQTRAAAYDSEDEEEHETPENDEEQLTQDQYNFIFDKKAQVQHLIPSALKEEELTKICVDFEFEEAKIDEYLKCLEIDEKYRGIAAFEWQQTQSKEQKLHERKQKQLQAERERRRKERLREQKERRDQERVEREARKEARRLEKEQKALEREARKAEREAKRLERIQRGEEEEEKGTTPKEETTAGENVEAETPAAENGESPDEAGKKKYREKREKKEPREKKERKPKERLVFKRKEVQPETTNAGEHETPAAQSLRPSTSQVEDEKEKEETEELLRKAVTAAAEETPSPKKVEAAPAKVIQPPQPVVSTK